MTSWFGSGLSQITGQISNFTKEVIEEGTGEVDDPVTQLKITQKHLLKLDDHNQIQQAELAKLNAVNCELQEKLESAELQINAISNEYREIVAKKDTEIKQLKLHRGDLCEGEYQVFEVPTSNAEAVSQLTHSSSAPTLNIRPHGNDHDFDDIISCQHEINRLQNEKKKLELQCLHWMQLVQPAEDRKETDQLHELQTKLEELQQGYDKEIDSHQVELAALHNAYSQKIAMLKHKHQDEISRQDELSEQRTQGGDKDAGPNSPKTPSDINDQLQHLQAVHQKLTVDLELTHAADREKAHRLQQLKQKFDVLQEEKKQVMEENETLVDKTDALMEQLDSVVLELRKKNEEIDKLTKDDQHIQESDSLDGTLKNPKMDAELKALSRQLLESKLQIEQFDLIKSDWQMEKEALEDVLLKLREQLREKDNAQDDFKQKQSQGECDVCKDISTSDFSMQTESDANTLMTMRNREAGYSVIDQPMQNERKTTSHDKIDERTYQFDQRTNHANTEGSCFIEDDDNSIFQEELKEMKHVELPWSERIKQLASENQTLERKINTMEKDMDLLVHQHQTALHEVESDHDKLLQEIGLLTTKLQELKKDRDTIEYTGKVKCNDLQNSVTELTTECHKITDTMHELQLTNNKLLESIAKIKEEKLVLATNFEEMIIDRDSCKNLCEKLTAQVTCAETELELVEKNIVMLTQDLSAAKEENQKHLQTIQELQEEKLKMMQENPILSRLQPDGKTDPTESNSQFGDQVKPEDNLQSAHDNLTEKSLLSISEEHLNQTTHEQDEDRITDLKTKIPDLLKRCSDQEAIIKHQDSKRGQIDLLTADIDCENISEENKKNEIQPKLEHSVEEFQKIEDSKCPDSNPCLDSIFEDTESIVVQNDAKFPHPNLAVKNLLNDTNDHVHVDDNMTHSSTEDSSGITEKYRLKRTLACEIMDRTEDHKVLQAEDEKGKKNVQQNDVISELSEKSSVFMKMFEEPSQGKTFEEINQLQNNVDSLQIEKNQIMSVLNDKTRECSSLKSEVRHLMNIVSAEKIALSKLQQENQRLVNTNETDGEIPNEDMSKEAIRKLSQIIQDKDMLIEALNQKNQSLLQVLQQSSPDMSSVIQERDNLLRQVNIFQNERENIIATLNIKHQESLAYHLELQRLSEIVAKHEQSQEELAHLQQRHEDKQHTIIKLQNEILNYKRKFTESSGKNMEETLHEGKSAKTDLSSLLSTHVDAENLKFVVQMHEQSIAEKDKIIECCTNSLHEKEHVVLQKEMEISDKETHLSDVNSRLHRTEETLFSKESEISNLKKQTENLTFQLHSIQTEVVDLRQERNQLYESNSILQQELAVMKKAMNRLTLDLNDKDFEIQTIKERKITLSKLIQEKGEGRKDEMDRIMKECEIIQKHSQDLKQEREQGLLAIQHQQTENQQLRNQIQRLNERKEKLEKELERLRNHLLAIEENYTHDALASEEREKELRNRLAAAEDRMMSSSSAVKTANQQILFEMETLQTQLSAVSEERDHAVLQLSNVQETANQYAVSLQNLQMVLEQFQFEKETQQNSEIEIFQKETSMYRTENRQLQEKICDLEAQAKETSDALEAAQRLSEQLDCKEEMIAALRDEGIKPVLKGIAVRPKIKGKMSSSKPRRSEATEGF